MSARSLYLAAAVAALLCVDGIAQSRNVQLLARVVPPSSDFSDIWAYYHVRTGKEYALIGCRAGTYVYDCTNPSSPVSRGLIPSDNTSSSRNIWRDMKTFGEYAYIVSEAHGGMQIVDLRNPDSPTKVSTFGASIWRNAHNIAMDLEEGIAYVCGTNSGLHIIDVKTNPTSPQLIASPSVPYIHDLSIQHGYAYLAEQNGNALRIHDVSNLPNFPLLGRINLPGSSIAHQTWPSWDDSVCLTTNEAANGPVAFFDVSNKRAPRQVAVYRAGPSSAIPHNGFIADRVAHISHYTEGYRSVDVSDASQPTEVGFYDTWQGSSSGYNGAWGCSLPQPSGTVYISDIQSGLFVLKPQSSTVKYGLSTAGQNGVVPTPHTFGAGFLGNSRFRIDVRGARAASPAVLVVGAGRASQVFNGIPVNVALTPAPVTVSFTTDAAGEGGVALPVPNNAAFNGAKLNAQFLVRDAAASTGFAATQGMEIEFFQR